LRNPNFKPVEFDTFRKKAQIDSLKLALCPIYRRILSEWAGTEEKVDKCGVKHQEGWKFRLINLPEAGKMGKWEKLQP